MLQILAYSLLAIVFSVQAAPFPQATSNPDSSSLLRIGSNGTILMSTAVSPGSDPVSATPTPTSSLLTDRITFSGVEVTSPTEWNLIAGNGPNIAITRSDTTFLARLATRPAQAGSLGGAPTTVTEAVAFDISPTRLAIVAIEPSLPDALKVGYSCDVQGTQLNCTVIGYSRNSTEFSTVYSALYEVAPTEVTAGPVPTGQALNEVLDNEQLADSWASAFSQLEGDAATASPTADYLSFRSALQSSLRQDQLSYIESLRTAQDAGRTSSTASPTPAA